MDFTTSKYKELLLALKENYKIYTVYDYLVKKPLRFVILRHDVDRRPYNALKMALIEYKLGIKSTYYFRTSTFIPKIVKSVEILGHEIGYHYETLDKANGNYEKAVKIFEKELSFMRKYVEIKTICSHGNPLTPFVNHWIWKKYDFKKYGIVGEAYLSINFNKLRYFSDTGRAWTKIKNTERLIEILKEKRFNVYILAHPDKWEDNYLLWVYDLFSQKIKNLIKKRMKKGGVNGKIYTLFKS